MSATNASRIVEIPEEQLTDRQRAALAAVLTGRGRLPTPYRIWLHSPELIGFMEQLGTFLTNRSSLSEPEAELAIIIVSQYWHGEYVLEAHTRRAVRVGLDAGIVDALREERPPATDEPRLRAVYEIATGFVRGDEHSDAVFDGAVEALGHGGIAELIALLGYFTSVSLAMKLYRVPISGRAPSPEE